MHKIGGIVWDYCLVIFFAILFLSAAHTRSLWESFVSLGLLAGLGVFHGLFLWPVVMQWIGPGATPHTEIGLNERESNTVVHFGSGAVATATGKQHKQADPTNPFAQQQIHPAVLAAQQAAAAAAPAHVSVEMASLGGGGDREGSQSRNYRDYNPHDPAFQPRVQQQQQQQQQMQNRGMATPQKQVAQPGRWV